MKWDDDEYKVMKNDILEIVLFQLSKQDAEQITMRQCFDAIDEFVNNLTKSSR